MFGMGLSLVCALSHLPALVNLLNQGLNFWGGLTAGKEQRVNGDHCCLPAEAACFGDPGSKFDDLFGPLPTRIFYESLILSWENAPPLVPDLVELHNQMMRLLAAVPRQPISLAAGAVWGLLLSRLA